MKARFILFLALFSLMSSRSAAQSVSDQFNIVINSICMIRCLGGDISMNMSTTTPGSSISPATNSNSYLQITSIVANNVTRSVSAAVKTGTAVPNGTLLKLVASNCTTGSGNRGTPLSEITLTSTNNKIIESIGSCYTGTSAAYGYKLTYTWSANSSQYNLIKATSSPTSLIVVYTIADD